MTSHQAPSLLHSAERDRFRDIEKHDFGFGHALSGSPLLRLEALRDLAGFMQTNNLAYHFESGERDKGAGWGAQPQNIGLLESFDQLERQKTLIILKSVHRHPAYAALLESFLRDVGIVIQRDMKTAYQRPICTILIASPRRVTPYHIDDSHNLLMQIRGAKTFYVFDGSNPDVLTEGERSAFWGGDLNAAVLTEAKQRQAKLYELGPGLGVHVPITYPHWAQNGDDISIAVSINFQSAHDRTMDVHAFNGFLRSRGFKPKAPGGNRLVDTSKAAAFRTLSGLRHLARRMHLPAA